MKKKQKGKAAVEDQDDEFVGLEDQDNGGDLFGDLAAETTKTTKAKPPVPPIRKEPEETKIQPTVGAYSQEKKVQFEDLLSRLENRVGKSLECTTVNR